MRAVLAHGPQRFELTELPTPASHDTSRVLGVEAVGVCAADRMLWHGTGPWNVRWPFVPGHEILGRDIDTGQRFTLEVSVPCGGCERCLAGRTNLCRNGRHFGSDLPGGFAEFVEVPHDAVLHPVPDELPATTAVLAEPTACALHAVHRAGVRAGDTVGVIGLGAVGALAVHAALSLGARQVLAVVRSPERAELARALGAVPVLAAADGTAPEVDELADAVVECSGNPAAVTTALRMAMPGGRLCLYSVYPTLSCLDLNQVAEFKELTVAGGHLAPGRFPAAVELLRSVPAELVVTGIRPLDDYADALGVTTGLRVKEVLLP